MTKALRNRYTRRRLGGAVALAAIAVVVLDAAAPAQRAPAAPAAAPAGPPVVAAGVSVGGLDVSGLTSAQAERALRTQALRRLAIAFGGETREFTPAALGASFDVDAGVRAALAAVPGTALPLDTTIDPLRLRQWARELARDVNTKPKSSRIVLRGKRPVATKSREGVKVKRAALIQQAASELRRGARGPLALPATIVAPRVTETEVGPAVVIRRASNRLFFYRGLAQKGMRLQRKFRVATGAAAFPTPLGNFTLVDKQRNPWWYPPPSPWAEGAKPVPPGPGNPLGTRWMGLSEPLIGIHGTPDAASIGYSASHGCIRMLVPEAEWLFERIPEGTPVFILDA